jgi:hypothetical protein
MSKLPEPVSQVLSIGFAFLVVAFFVFVIFMMVMKALGYKKILKRAQSYSEIVANTPELQKYLDQGYHLLTIIPQDSKDGYTFTTGVFDYPSRSQINALPLFCVEHANPKPNTQSLTLKGVFQTEIHNRACSSILSDYTQQLPLTAATDISFDKGLLSPEFTFTVRKEDVPFLKMSLPSLSLKGLSLENAYTITCSHMPDSQQWWWDCSKQQTHEYQLIEKLSNRTLLISIPGRTPFANLLTELSYMVVHPEMRKELVPVFVELSLLAKRRRSNLSD